MAQDLGLGKFGGGDGFPNTSLLLVEQGYKPSNQILPQARKLQQFWHLDWTEKEQMLLTLLNWASLYTNITWCVQILC